MALIRPFWFAIKYIWYLFLVIISGVCSLLHAVMGFLVKNGYVDNAYLFAGLLALYTLIRSKDDLKDIGIITIILIIIFAPPLYMIVGGIASFIITTIARIADFVLSPVQKLYEWAKRKFKCLRDDIEKITERGEWTTIDLGLWKTISKHKGCACKWAEEGMQHFRKEYSHWEQEYAEFQYEKKLNDMTPYDRALHLFELKKGFSQKELRAQYLKLSKKWHPDNHPNDLEFAENQMKKITEAYLLLKV